MEFRNAQECKCRRWCDETVSGRIIGDIPRSQCLLRSRSTFASDETHLRLKLVRISILVLSPELGLDRAPAACPATRSNQDRCSDPVVSVDLYDAIVADMNVDVSDLCNPRQAE